MCSGSSPTRYYPFGSLPSFDKIQDIVGPENKLLNGIFVVSFERASFRKVFGFHGNRFVDFEMPGLGPLFGARSIVVYSSRAANQDDGAGRGRALAGGEASNDVVEYCAKSFDFVRVSRMRAMVLASLVAFFMLLSAISIERFVAERSTNSRSKGQFLASTAVLELESNPELAFLLARKASDRGETPAKRSSDARQLALVSGGVYADGKRELLAVAGRRVKENRPKRRFGCIFWMEPRCR